MSTSSDLRAYINPQPAQSEAEQKGLVAKYEPKQYYVESRKEIRSAWIGSLRPTSVALVSDAFVIAKATGRKDGRFADFLCGKDKIHERGSYILEASTGHRSNDKKEWPIMRARAFEMFGRAVKKGTVGKPPLGYTDSELWAMHAVMESRSHKNWPQRRDAIRARGIKVPGRSWALTKLPLIIAKMASGIEPAPMPRKRKSLVYFFQDGDKVKIGHSIDPKKRLAAVSTHSELKLILTMPGGHQRENELHKKFAAHRIKGEWFKLSPPIIDFIRKRKRT